MNTVGKERLLHADCREGPAVKSSAPKVSDEIRAECSLRKQVPSELQLTAEQAQGPTSDSMEACAAGQHK